MRTRYSGSSVKGNIVAPPSKERTQMAILLSSMAFGKSIIRNPLLCDDTFALISALRSFSASIDERNGDLYVSGGYMRAQPEVDCGHSVAALKYMAALCSIFHKRISLNYSGILDDVQISPLLESLRKIGAECTDDPVSVKGPVIGGDTSFDDLSDTQAISALMLTAPFLKEGLRIHVCNGVSAVPEIAMTENVMSKFDVPVFYEDDIIRIEYGGYKPAMMDISGDYHAAAYPMVAAALSGSVTVYGLDPNEVQNCKIIERFVKEAGADVERITNATAVRQNALSGRDMDVGHYPDLFPLLSILAAGVNGKSRLYGLSGQKILISHVCDMLERLGVSTEITDDGCIVNGNGRMKGCTVRSFDDPRVAMSAAVASLIADGPVIVDGSECILSSYPNFDNDMRSIGMITEEVE